MNGSYNVFIVDADQSANIGLARLLRTSGYNVFSFKTIGELPDVLNSETKACLLLDAGLPDFSIKRLKKGLVKYQESVVLIFVSSDDDDESRKLAKELNAVGFFRKPVDGPALLDAIKWALKSENSEKKI